MTCKVALSVAIAAACVACGETDATTAIRNGSAPLNTKVVVVTHLSMTVHDVDSLGVPYRIKSDGQGAYVDGQQGMQVQIDNYGNLQISPNTGSSSTNLPERTLSFDYSAPVDPLNTYRPNESTQVNFKILSNKVNNGNPGIDQLGVNGNPFAGCYNATIAHSNGSTSYRDVFNVASDSAATYLYVKRVSITPAIWTIVSDGPCITHANWAAVASQSLAKGNQPIVPRGYYDQRLFITLQAF